MDNVKIGVLKRWVCHSDMKSFEASLFGALKESNGRNNAQTNEGRPRDRQVEYLLPFLDRLTDETQSYLRQTFSPCCNPRIQMLKTVHRSSRNIYNRIVKI